jgi:hypothetical protein
MNKYEESSLKVMLLNKCDALMTNQSAQQPMNK